ncbi:MAG: hypothetical protein Q4A55_06680 [Aerococcus sp.]|nr:hypothetical protein [Aerococcus sp.]
MKEGLWNYLTATVRLTLVDGEIVEGYVDDYSSAIDNKEFADEPYCVIPEPTIDINDVTYKDSEIKDVEVLKPPII